MTENRRRTVLVNPEMQRRMVLGVSAVPVLILLAAATGTLWYGLSLMSDLETAGVPVESVGIAIATMLIGLCAAGVAIVVRSLHGSHQVAGPLYRLVTSIRRIRDGELDFRVKLRDGDAFVELADELNLLLDWLRAHPPAGTAAPSGAAPERDAARRDPESVPAPLPGQPADQAATPR
jgi:hypothetical protein